MWLFTTDGFFSVVTAAEFDEELQVRARAAADLDRLRDQWLPELGPSVSIPHRDYPWRAFTSRTALAGCLSRIAMEIDYDNFKDAVADRLGHDRAHTYLGVWSACRNIQDEKTFLLPPERSDTGTALDYETADLFELGEWPDEPVGNRRFGAVLLDDEGRLLLREPLNHFDGYVWTFPKGKPEPGERPIDTARRETLEETGYDGAIVGHVPGVFQGSPNGSANYFYLMRVSADAAADARARRNNAETAAVRWVTPTEAKALIEETTNRGGRRRDLEVLAAARSVARI